MTGARQSKKPKRKTEEVVGEEMEVEMVMEMVVVVVVEEVEVAGEKQEAGRAELSRP